jgi:hypothetical protein
MDFNESKLKTAALFDTNIWIALGASPAYYPKLLQISELRKKGKLHIAVPEVLLLEYKRHRPKIEKGWKSNVAREIDLSDLKRIIPENAKQVEEIEVKLAALAKPAMDIEPQSLRLIDESFAKATCVEINDQTLASAARSTVEKKAPSHSKDSIADTLIWEAVRAHLPKYNVFFVTANTTNRHCTRTFKTRLRGCPVQFRTSAASTP